MVRALIATAVYDVREILDGCGSIIELKGLSQLAGTVQYMLECLEEADKNS